MSDLSRRRPRFCPHCGDELPPGEPRFCVACGEATGYEPVDTPPAAAAPAATGPTVLLANATVPQEVIGGTIKLPALGAVPPGLWDRDHPPGPEDVVALYPPLRAVAGGWSGLTGRGWRAAGSKTRSGVTTYRFLAAVEWFPTPGCGGGLRLLAEIEASSRSPVEGRERRGFRFGLTRDGPMRVVQAEWRDEQDQALALPLPQIQLMAPPRVPRMADLAEEPVLLGAREAAAWAEGSLILGAYRLLRVGLQQEHTPVGRGALLVPLRERDTKERPWWQIWFGEYVPVRYRVRSAKPLHCPLSDWPRRLSLIREEAGALGLNLEPALAAEWWLDRNGYDAVLFNGAEERYGVGQVLIVFRKAQLAQIRD